jgi:hypothetical protein
MIFKNRSMIPRSTGSRDAFGFFAPMATRGQAWVDARPKCLLSSCATSSWALEASGVPTPRTQWLPVRTPEHQRPFRKGAKLVGRF